MVSLKSTMTARRIAFSLLLFLCSTHAALAADPAYFGIRVVDSSTGRGIPMVELKAVNDVLYVTDSAGLAAIYKPWLQGQRVFFHIRSHGYDYPKDKFGYQGFRAKIEPGKSITIKMRRLNVAERLWRVTGEGIYRDSVLLGIQTPLKNPTLNGGVLGQDSVVNALFGGELLWFWGDTNRASYPLGNFAVSGARSALSLGADLEYFVDKDGFSRKMCPIEGPGPVWIFGLMAVEEDGRERLLAHYSRMKNLGERLEHGIVEWNAETKIFEKLRQFPLDAPLYPTGHPVRATEEGEEWFYFPDPYPSVRVRAKVEDIINPSRYEGFTCLRPGSRWDNNAPPIDRDESGILQWAWRTDTAHVSPRNWGTILQKGLAKHHEGWHHLTDIETGEAILAHGGSVYWNTYRRRWTMIALQVMGRSMLGEVWYAEAPVLAGPWVYARRIVTHDKYSFYNVKQHPYFDTHGGKKIYFEGTYTSTFSGNPTKTPRYDYNQIMYSLDLSDERTVLPEPIYRTELVGRYRLSVDRVPSHRKKPRFSQDVKGPPEFFAVETGRHFSEKLISLPNINANKTENYLRLVTPFSPTINPDTMHLLVFQALPVNSKQGTPLYEWIHAESSRVDYLVEDDRPEGDGWERSESPLCRVWRNPAHAASLEQTANHE